MCLVTSNLSFIRWVLSTILDNRHLYVRSDTSGTILILLLKILLITLQFPKEIRGFLCSGWNKTYYSKTSSVGIAYEFMVLFLIPNVSILPKLADVSSTITYSEMIESLKRTESHRSSKYYSIKSQAKCSAKIVLFDEWFLGPYVCTKVASGTF